jgi:exodeoxyribonuclease-3
MHYSVATWNINSVRLRIGQVTRFLEEHAPDALCLQEIKCRDEQFPLAAIRKAGYEHVAIYGNKGYHGVAIVARHPFRTVTRHHFCEKEDGRAVSVEFESGPMAGIELANFYVPAGGDIPDPEVNERFAHKLSFLDQIAPWSERLNGPGKRSILVGDLNVAPLEHDVWSHKQLLNVVSHTPIEVEKFGHVTDAGQWRDVMRAFVPSEEKLYTWWSYRAFDWRASNRGRRLDHVWASPALAGSWQDMKVLDMARDWERPSDHVPVMVRFES